MVDNIPNFLSLLPGGSENSAESLCWESSGWFNGQVLFKKVVLSCMSTKSLRIIFSINSSGAVSNGWISCAGSVGSDAWYRPSKYVGTVTVAIEVAVVSCPNFVALAIIKKKGGFA